MIASGVLHAALLMVLLVNRGPELTVAVAGAEVVRINLMPPPQSQADAREAAPALVPPAEAPLPLPDTRPEAQLEAQPAPNPDAGRLPAPEPPAEQTAGVEVPQANLSNLFERTERATDAEQPPASPQVPTVAAIRSELGQMQASDRALAWGRDCTRRQQQSAVLDCPDTELPSYSTAPGEAIYRALNPVREISRSERSMPAVAANVTDLAQRLADSAIPEELAGYLLEQTQTSITDSSNSGNRTVEHMRRMTDRSAAAEQARMLLDDPWVVNRLRELEQRKID